MATNSDNNAYPPGGALFINSRKTGKGPDLTGSLEISKDVLDSLLEAAKSKQPMKMELAAWKKVSSRDKSTFYSLTAKRPWTGASGGSSKSSDRGELDF